MENISCPLTSQTSVRQETSKPCQNVRPPKIINVRSVEALAHCAVALTVGYSSVIDGARAGSRRSNGSLRRLTFDRALTFLALNYKIMDDRSFATVAEGLAKSGCDKGSSCGTTRRDGSLRPTPRRFHPRRRYAVRSSGQRRRAWSVSTHFYETLCPAEADEIIARDGGLAKIANTISIVKTIGSQK
jgi:hypothetical protein